jgi:hypothetical protein
VNDQKVFKFKQLIEACLETKNYIKLAATTLMLLRNTVISHTHSLQIPHKSDAYIHEIMLQVNRVLSLKSSVSMYKASMIARIKLIENLMKKGKGKIPLRFIKDATAIFFDLQQISIPSRETMIDASNRFSFKGFFSRFNNSENESPILQLITQELSSREQSLRSRANTGKDEIAMMELQKISRLKASLTSNISKKIQINGPISEDQRYILFLAQSKAYPLFGMFLLFLILSLLVLVQMTLNLALLAPLGTFFLMFGGGAALSLYLYSLAKRKEVNVS